ncbi:MAG: c-type cytochrome domain-containing protein [Ferruginibacter sp.]
MTISEFVGRFHPVLVHLPVGILLLAVLLYFLSFKKQFESLRPAVQISLLAGLVSGAFSCITGFLLSQSGDYDEALVFKHQWFAIGMTVITGIAWFMAVKKHKYLKWVLLLTAVLLTITGHLGGSITHGEGYLTASLSAEDNKEAATKPIANVQQALVYQDIIQPILKTKCYSCHAASKQKGKLRLDEPSFILKGGAEGKVIIPGSAGESDLIKRILLATDNEDHMPPKEKPQLTSQQTELLAWWVNNGADFNIKVAEINQPPKIKTCLDALQSGTKAEATMLADIPAKEVEKADPSILAQLRRLNVSVTAVSQTSNYLTANMVAADSITNEVWLLLKKLNKQLIWLKANNKKLADSNFSGISALTELRRLSIDNSSVTDNGMQFLDKLSQLQYLNLSGTHISGKGLESLRSLKNLKQLYLYNTAIGPADATALKKVFPKTLIDTGGYKLEFLPADTMIVKAKTIK